MTVNCVGTIFDLTKKKQKTVLSSLMTSHVIRVEIRVIDVEVAEGKNEEKKCVACTKPNG